MRALVLKRLRAFYRRIRQVGLDSTTFMDWTLIILALCFYFAGLLFWPVFQILHRRWSPCAKRLLVVFSITSGALLGTWFLVFGFWGHCSIGWLLFPVVNLVSLIASVIILIVSSKRGRVNRLHTRCHYARHDQTVHRGLVRVPEVRQANRGFCALSDTRLW